jgi:hypothetical protein
MTDSFLYQSFIYNLKEDHILLRVQDFWIYFETRTSVKFTIVDIIIRILAQLIEI